MRLTIAKKFGFLTLFLGLFAISSHYLLIKFWSLMRDVPVEEFSSEYNWLLSRLYFTDALVFMVATVLFLTSFRSIINPLKQLTEIIRQTRKKNYDVDFPAGGVDEIGVLIEELKKMVEDVQEQKKARSDFITSISHQLPTPISHIRLELNDLEQKIKDLDGNEAAMQILKNIKTDNELSVKLANDIIELIEIGENYHAFNKTDFLIKPIVSSIFGALKDQIGKKRLNFEINIEDDLQVYGEEVRIKSALFNVIENAVWYANKNGIVTVGVKKEKDAIVLVVENTGIGIGDKDKMHVFDKFYRAQNAYMEQTVGTGLGLSITKIILNGHGGSVWFDSAENEGVFFYISIPCRKDSE